MQTADILAALPLERAAATPLFRQLYTQVKEAILRGVLAPGVQLPPTRELCRLLDVSRQTVLNAYDQLMAEGYLSGTVGRGTFVADNLPLPRPMRASAPRMIRPLSARGQGFAATMAHASFHRAALKCFQVSMPALDLFPFDTWSKLEARRFRRPDYHFGYSDPAGYLPLREMLCVYLRASRGVVCEPEQIVITSGSQQALFLLANLLLAPGEEAWLETPCYQGARAALEAAGAKVRSVPVTPEGMDVSYATRHYPDARLVFATPSHQLPLGVTMSLARRLELLAWARESKAWIIEDDYDSEYRYTGPPLASLQSLDQAGCVVYVGTLSKVLVPGLRMGYVVAPPGLVEALTRAKALVDMHSPIVPQMVLADFIAAGHFGRHIKRTRAAYAERRDAMLGALDKHMPHLLAPGPADAGLDICAFFKRGHDEAQVEATAREQGVLLRPLSYYGRVSAPRAFAVPPGLLLGFSAFTPRDIDGGMRTLARVMGKLD